MVDVFLRFSGAESVGIVSANDVAEFCALIILSVVDFAIVKAVDFVVSSFDIIGLIVVDSWIVCAIFADDNAANEDFSVVVAG